MTKLPVQPIPFEDESAASLLIRAAEANGHLSVYALLSERLNSSEKSILNGDLNDPVRFQRIIELLGMNYSVNSLIAKRVGFTDRAPRQLGSTIFPNTLFRRDGIAYCPECLKEAPYLRKNWMFTPYCVCVRHSREILDCCIKCTTKLNPNRGSICLCSKCGYDISLTTTKSVSTTEIKYFIEQLKTNEQMFSNEFSELWKALNKIVVTTGQDISPIDILKIMYYFYTEENNAIKKMASLINRSSKKTHPRITLIPFFLGTKRMQFFAEMVTTKTPISRTVDQENTIMLSKSEAKAALGLSNEKLNTLIRKGFITWPKINGREQKISSKNIEEYLRKKVYNAVEIKSPTLKKVNAKKYWDTKKIGTVLQVNTETARSVLKSNWLNSERKVIDGHSKIVALKNDVLEFHKKYLLIGAFARERKLNPTNLAEKLMKLGVKPIAGRTIDGLLTTLFNRNELDKIDTKVIEEVGKYDTKAGRKENSENLNIAKADSGVSLAEAGRYLRLSPHKVAVLVKHEILKRNTLELRRILIQTKSVFSLMMKLNNKKFLTIENAAKELDCSPAWLYINIINTGFIRLHDLKYWKFVTKAALKRIKELRHIYFTTTEASLQLGWHRSVMTNLERQGLIKSTTFGNKKSLVMYKKADVEELKLRLSQYPSLTHQAIRESDIPD
jgi:hypothetical protein